MVVGTVRKCGIWIRSVGENRPIPFLYSFSSSMILYSVFYGPNSPLIGHSDSVGDNRLLSCILGRLVHGLICFVFRLFFSFHPVGCIFFASFTCMSFLVVMNKLRWLWMRRPLVGCWRVHIWMGWLFLICCGSSVVVCVIAVFRRLKLIILSRLSRFLYYALWSLVRLALRVDFFGNWCSWSSLRSLRLRLCHRRAFGEKLHGSCFFYYAFRFFLDGNKVGVKFVEASVEYVFTILWWFRFLLYVCWWIKSWLKSAFLCCIMLIIGFLDLVRSERFISGRSRFVPIVRRLHVLVRSRCLLCFWYVC